MSTQIGTDDPRDDQPLVIGFTKGGEFAAMDRDAAKVVAADLTRHHAIVGLRGLATEDGRVVHQPRGSAPDVREVLDISGKSMGFAVVVHADAARDIRGQQPFFDDVRSAAAQVCAALAKDAGALASNARAGADIYARHAATGCPHYNAAYIARNREADAMEGYAAQFSGARVFTASELPKGITLG